MMAGIKGPVLGHSFDANRAWLTFAALSWSKLSCPGIKHPGDKIERLAIRVPSLAPRIMSIDPGELIGLSVVGASDSAVVVPESLNK